MKINQASPQIITKEANIDSENEDNSEIESDSFMLKKQQKIQLIWENIKLQTIINKKPQEILKGISGTANPGELLAIMGQSGAGKSSLLNIISGISKSSDKSTFSGTVKANSIDIFSINYEKYRAYVTQDDILLPFLTARESLTIAASLKCLGSSEEIKCRVDKLIKELKLENSADNIVGNLIYNGISGGERKRVSIGVELISEPQIVILDEPTSGLDSFTAEIIIDLLKKQAEKGKTIVFTIHQPSSSIFNKFDKLLLLTEGYAIYQGKASKSKKYFRKLGFKCPRLINPADYYIKVLHIVNRYRQTEEEQETLKTLVNSYKENENKVVYEITNLDFSIKTAKVSSCKKVWLLCKRIFIDNIRNPGPTIGRFSYFIVTAVLLDLIFNNQGSDYSSLQNIAGVLYLVCIQHTLVGNTSGCLDFPLERGCYLKETSQGLYGTLTFYVAKMIAELPLHILSVLIASILIYFPVGLNLVSPEKFFLYVLINILGTLMGQSIGYWIGVFCPDEATALGAGQMIVTPLTIFGGFFVNLDRINEAFSWLQYISPYRWTFEALCINQYTDMEISCEINGEKCDVLKTLGFSHTLGEVLAIQISYILIARFIAYWLFKLISVKNKHI